jgi:hypothetical protein
MSQHARQPGKRASEAAARTYLRAHLSWLRGFPVGAAGDETLGWIAFPKLNGRARAQRLQIDRQLLRRTTFAHNSAVRRFPRAMRRVVGDLGRWRRDVNTKLALVKQTIHDGRRAPHFDQLLKVANYRESSRLRALATANRGLHLKPLLSAYAWIHWGNDEAFVGALSVLDEHAAELRTVLAMTGDIRVVLHLCDLAAESVDATRILAVLGDVRAWTVPLWDHDLASRMAKALKERCKGGDRPTGLVKHGFSRPPAPLGHHLAKTLLALQGTEPKTRKRIVQLIALLAAEAPLTEWSTWWTRADQLERTVRRLLATRRPTLYDRNKMKELAGRLDGLLAAPPPYRLSKSQPLVEQAAAPSRAASFPPLLEALKAVSGHHKKRLLREALLEEWVTETRGITQREALIRTLVRAQATLLQAHPTLSQKQKAWICTDLIEELVDTWITQSTPTKLIAPTVSALEATIRIQTDWDDDSGPFADHLGWATLVASVKLTGDPHLAAKLVAAAAPTEFDLTLTGWTALCRMSRRSPARLRALAERWRAPRWHDHLIEELERLSHDPDRGDLLYALVLDGQGERVRQLVSASSFLRAFAPKGLKGWDRPPLTLTAPELGLAHYPTALQRSLSRLAKASPRATHIAERVLGSDFPSPERLRREIENLTRLIKDAPAKREAALVARLSNLRKRLDAPRPTSEPRLARCLAKLERRIRLCTLASWEASLRDQLELELRRLLEARPPQTWLKNPLTLGLLSALTALSPKFRALGIRVFRARLGPAPWDFRDEPANREFLIRLASNGTDPKPWLEGIGERTVPTPHGELSLDMESDPLELLRMGEPFDTCLAPGAFNFFSAVANAADVNKRVIYIRNSAGKIQGRCLIAITDAFSLLTFRVYAQRCHAELESAVRSYVKDLAKAMHTTIVAKGQVTSLVASNWYDDGPIDLLGKESPLEPGAALRERLDTIRPNELLPALESALSPQPISASHVVALVDLLGDRPELVVPLLAREELLASLDPGTLLRVASLARRAGKVRAAVVHVTALARGEVRGGCCNHCLQSSLADELIHLGLPHRVLRFLRRTRSAGIHGWNDEPPDRLALAARASALLHRPRKALRLYELARAKGAKHVTETIRELEDALAP